jgi:2-polyprenyl-6-methoxyphenol hydroxylase-like FAD-dependent oxidoreductase
MLAVLDRLPDPVLTDLVRAAEPAGDVHAYRRAGNVRHHYERLADWPDGLLAVGDSLCAFDPVYGQGISVAARQALLLRDALAGADGRPADVPGRDLLRRLQRVADLPWSVSTGADRGFPAAGDGRMRPLERALGWWAGQVSVLSTHGDDRAQAALSRVYHLVGSPAELLAPTLVVAAVRGRLLGLPPPEPRPSFPLSPAPTFSG